MSHPPALKLSNICKRYGPVTALHSVDLTLNKHEILGLVGENGAGKSTMISVINGTVRPTEGTLAVNGEEFTFGHTAEAGRVGVATVFQEQGLIGNLPVYENILLGRESEFSRLGIRNRAAMVRLTQEVLDDLGLDISPYAITGNLTFGQRQLVEIAKAFALGRIYPVDPIILLDEPTSALSDKETQIFFDLIRKWRGKASIIFISHHLSDVFEVCDSVVALRDGTVNGRWPIEEATPDILHEAIVGRKRSAGYYKETEQREELGEVVLDVQDVSIPGEIHDITFEVRAGEIVGVAGVLGSGKTDLGKVITGEKRQGTGSVRVNGVTLKPGSRASALEADVGSIPSERNVAGVIGMHSIEWNLTLPALKNFKMGNTPFLSSKAQAETTDWWIDRLKVKTPSRAVLISNMSGGNAQKVVFAKWLARGVKVFVLDDPCRGLDVGAKEEIYILLRELAREGVAIVLISDNLPEVIGLSNRILVLRSGIISAEIPAPIHSKPSETSVVSRMV
ncbi:sugar ABC transporter ATP-binding protein [Celeribacter litoreus]|uniref:sugar ABC transporter ATP-binding protein n=1 Tax=Celeribacter litoreus TaxID=2876714 RepID=UPI001CC96F7C|nr:sugar ABC transporter ATP-binding protein [Celeribacter litoreus]MCA0043399.1 sugar ABC transporter ATP-binding protein [Celeribacter litoreus]